MQVIARRRAGRTGNRNLLVPVLAALVCGLMLLLAGCSDTSKAATASPPPGTPYTLMQTNLCLSGIAGCYRKVDYPAGVRDVVNRIREVHPDAVTLSEACSGDATSIARQTGYYVRFSQVIYYGKLLPCVKPGARGMFGDAVLTRAPIDSSENRAFGSQAGPEQRRWLCVSTRIGVQVCTAHLASAAAVEAAANKPQCAELSALLARRASAGTVIFGGDVNRHASCAPRGFWTRTDSSAHQDPGSQQAYGTGRLRFPSVQVEPALHTDHDVLLVSARLTS